MTVTEALVDAHTRYRATVSPAYDEVLNDVCMRVAKVGSVGKADIGALLFWKRLRADTPWAARLHAIEEEQVRNLTKSAVGIVRDTGLSLPEAASAGRRVLTALPGFATGDALASAVLLAGAPDRMAVYDRRAQRGLERLGIALTSSRGRYGRYIETVERLLGDVAAAGHVWTPRDVDVALYWLGG